MAPFQHVHLSAGHDHNNHHEAGDHEHRTGALVHSHFLEAPAVADLKNEPKVQDSDRDHVSRPIETFNALRQFGFAIPALLASRVPIAGPQTFLARTIEPTESCGHDPPVLAFLIPRAPPA
jgi:hypothetical protein